MAITQVTTVTVDGITIGLSDEIGTLIQNGDFTPENLAPYMFCGNKTIGTTRYGSLSGSQKIYSGSSASQGLWFPVVCTTRYGAATVEYALNDDIALENQCYGRNILVYGESPTSEIHSGHTESTLRVVTSVDFQKLYYDVELSADTISSTRPSAVTKTYYKSGSAGKVKTITNNVDTSIYIYDIFVDELLNEWYCILDYHFPGSDTANHQWKMCPTQKIEGNYGAIADNLYDGWSSFALTRAQWRWGPNTAYTIYGGENQDWGEGHNFDAFVDLGGDTVSFCDYDPYRAYCTCYVCGLDNALKQVANAGLRFKYNNTWYKPIGEGGVITGYTDDMTEESEWDDIEDVTGNDVPVTPPGPTPPPTPSGDEDDIDSMGFDGMSCSVGGPAKYYIMSYSDIHHLIGDFNAHAEPGTTISNNIISCYVNALDWNWTTGSEAIVIYSGGAQTTAFTSDMNYKVISGYNARDIIGSIDVPRMTNTFYDFAPYSTYEVYVPFCGWVALPDTVAGRSIKIYFETDEATCGCKGRVFFVDENGNGVTVAEITGSFGAPCPIQILEGGLYKQAMLSNGLQVIGGVASGVMGGAMGAGALAVSGLSSAMQSLGNCLIAGNTNYGQTIGRAGDTSGLMCAGKPYLKITYPPLDEVVNNSRFGHTIGYLCNTIGKLSTFSGFTVCANPHITGINCTDSEKEELKRLLEEGVIL